MPDTTKEQYQFLVVSLGYVSLSNCYDTKNIRFDVAALKNISIQTRLNTFQNDLRYSVCTVLRP